MRVRPEYGSCFVCAVAVLAYLGKIGLFPCFYAQNHDLINGYHRSIVSVCDAKEGREVVAGGGEAVLGRHHIVKQDEL